MHSNVMHHITEDGSETTAFSMNDWSVSNEEVAPFQEKWNEVGLSQLLKQCTDTLH